MNISLIGMPGSGKSSVAPFLSAALGSEWVDTDELIEKSYGKIADIFKNSGEKRFRAIEKEIIKSLSDIKNMVIATGGGCVLDPENVEILKSLGKVVYLKTEVSVLVGRIKRDGSRPLVSGDPEKRLSALYAARDALYCAAADIVVGTDGLSAQGVAKKISESIK